MADQPRRFSMEANAGSLTPGPIAEVIAPTPLSIGMSLQPSFDVIELLPPAAQGKLHALREHAADAHTVIPAGYDLQAASAERVADANARKRLTDLPPSGFGLMLDDRQVIAAQKKLDRATENFERIRLRYETKTAAWHAASAALANAEAWLKHGRPPGVQLLDYDGPEPKLLKSENGLLDAIENRRRRVRELKADLHRIRSSPFPSAHAKAKMRAQVEALAMRSAPEVSLLIETDGDLIWPTMSIRSETVGLEQRALAFAEVPDAFALAVWLHKDALIAALDREISTEADDKAALTHEARAKAEAEVQGDLLAVERDEAALTWSAMEQRLPVEFRSDCNPLAILQVRLVTTPRADALPGTSPEHAYDIRGAGRQR